MNKKRNGNLPLQLFTIVFFGLFYYFLPFAGDDWAWGSEIGIQRLKNAFDGYNGRYLGNLLIIIVIRSQIAKVVICSLFMFLLIFVLSKIFDGLSGDWHCTKNYIISFSSVLLLVLPNQISFGELQPFQIFGSTVGWLSGFTNYVVPSVLILIYYYFVTSRGFEKISVYVLLALIGICACLCVEHYTLFCLIFSLCVAAYRYFLHKKICKKSLSFFAGSLTGALIMFSNSSYRLMQKGNVGEKQRSVGFFGSLEKYAAFIFPKSTDRMLVVAFEAVLFAMILIFFVFFFIKTVKIFKNGSVSKFLPIICMVVMTIPLLFTNSGKEIYVVAPRCYFLQYFMLVIFIFGKYAEKSKNQSTSGKAVPAKVIKASFCVLVLITSALYAHLDCLGAVRDNAVNEALENNYRVVEILEYPKSAERIQWSSNFIKNEIYLERYKKIKNIPKSTAVKTVQRQNLTHMK